MHAEPDLRAGLNEFAGAIGIDIAVFANCVLVQLRLSTVFGNHAGPAMMNNL
jgi:hypothetical protein